MDNERSKFAGGDQKYLADEQYADAENLAKRAKLHTYGTARLPWFDWVAPHFSLEADSDVLEAGCGAGWLWERTNSRVPSGIRLTLTDLSPGMVDEATARVEGTGKFASVMSQAADLQSLPFSAQSFDRVVANHMLYHLPDPDLGVREIVRVMRPGGIAILATNGQRHMREIWELRAATFGHSNVDETIDVFGAETGFAILRNHFANVSWHAYRDELLCTEPDDVLDYLCSTPPAETADHQAIASLRRDVDRAFELGGGVLRISKDVGCFVCSDPT